jgi:hypothetical protein
MNPDVTNNKKQIPNHKRIPNYNKLNSKRWNLKAGG